MFNPNKSEVDVGSNSKLPRLFDYSSIPTNPEKLIKLEPTITKSDVHDASIYFVDYSSDGSLLATGSNDKSKFHQSERRPSPFV